MDKFRFKASILPILKLKASTATQVILSGSTQQLIKLKGSVVTFATSLTTRAIILPKVTLIVKAFCRKFVKNSVVISRVQLSAKAMVRKFSKVILNIKVIIYAKATVNKNAKAIITFEPIIGKDSLLSQIKNKTLGTIKTLTLKELTFSVGVRAFVIKKAMLNFLPKVSINANAVVVRKTKLVDIKAQTLGQIKNDTLKELTEYNV